MDDDQLIGELERLAALDGGPASPACEEVVHTLKTRAGQYQVSAQHGLAIALLRRARQIVPNPELDRMLALALGSKAELVMRWGEALRTLPASDLVETIEADLRDAIAADPALGDPYWDLAVVAARYRADYTSAAQHLAAALSHGYQHPMLPHLAAMIQAKPPLARTPDSPGARLRQLLLALAVQAVGPYAGSLLDEEPSHSAAPVPGAGRTFGDYVAQAQSIAAHAAIAEQEYLGLLAGCAPIGGGAGEYVADLLRRLAEATGGKDFVHHATHRHLGWLRDTAANAFDRRTEGAHRIRQAGRAAKRGLKIVDAARTPIDPDLHADLLIQRGQALYYEKEAYAAEAIRCYRKALELKRQAGNAEHVARLSKLLWQQIDARLGRALASLHIAGIGEALEVFEVCAQVARELDDPARALGVQLHLAQLRRQVGQHREAEALLHEILAGTPSAEVVRGARFELASIYSETSRPEQAAMLQKELLAQSEPQGTTEPNLWSNYANSLRLLGDRDGARLALEKAWDRLPPEQKAKVGNTVPSQGARTRTLQAQLAMEAGDLDTALHYLDAAAALDATPHGLDALHYYEIKARCLLAAKRAIEARACLDTALHNLGFALSHGPSLPTWESVLQQWSRLDVLAVRASLASAQDDAAEHALLRAESAKGRVLAWLEHRRSPEGAERALSLERQQASLARARQWLKQRPGRCILSLFGSDEGLGLFGIDGEGTVTGTWLDDFDYGRFRTEVYEPWERARDQALTGGTAALEQALEASTEQLLDVLGAWLERGHAALAAGGEALVVVPHRLLRNLPLAHARLPGPGRRLSALFESVLVAPSLSRFGDEDAAKPSAAQDMVTACADADQTLPFARCEALLCAGPERAVVGDAVTVEHLRAAFRTEGTLLVSLHGEFDRDNPFQSRLHAADGALPLHEALLLDTRIRPRVLVLGACEAGRSRRSLSDEPLGFPTLFLQGGAALVLAPLWEVDDFASFLFVTKVFEATSNGRSFERAVAEATDWLREATASAALQQLAALTKKVTDLGPAGRDALARLAPLLGEQRTWLEAFEPSERPFASPLDWMAFQLSGAPRAG